MKTKHYQVTKQIGTEQYFWSTTEYRFVAGNWDVQPLGKREAEFIAEQEDGIVIDF